MNKKILIIVVAVVLVIAVVATVGYMINNSKPYTVWTDLTYAGTTPAGFHNSTIEGYDGIQAENLTYYNYTFTVNTNTLTPMNIQDHCVAVIPHWSEFTPAFTYTAVNSTSWRFNIGIEEVGPTYLVSPKWGTTETQGPSLPPLTQEQIDTINADFQSQNT